MSDPIKLVGRCPMCGQCSLWAQPGGLIHCDNDDCANRVAATALLGARCWRSPQRYAAALASTAAETELEFYRPFDDVGQPCGGVECDGYNLVCLACFRAHQALAQRPTERCEACGGSGEWETECCNGAGGCHCHGQRVQMGACHACDGRGVVEQQRPMANFDFIVGNRISYPGGGPR